MLVAFKISGPDSVKNRIEAYVDRCNPILELQSSHKAANEWFINCHVDMTEEGLGCLKEILNIVADEDGTIE